MKKFFAIAVCLSTLALNVNAQSMSIVNHTSNSCPVSISIDAHDASRSASTSQFLGAAGFSATFTTVASIPSGVGIPHWFGPGLGVAGSAWDAVHIIFGGPGAVVTVSPTNTNSGVSVTDFDPMSCTNSSNPYATWTDVSGNITVDIYY